MPTSAFGTFCNELVPSLHSLRLARARHAGGSPNADQACPVKGVWTEGEQGCSSKLGVQ
jgi:hypothetical protein